MLYSYQVMVIPHEEHAIRTGTRIAKGFPESAFTTNNSPTADAWAFLRHALIQCITTPFQNSGCTERPKHLRQNSAALIEWVLLVRLGKARFKAQGSLLRQRDFILGSERGSFGM